MSPPASQDQTLAQNILPPMDSEGPLHLSDRQVGHIHGFNDYSSVPEPEAGLRSAAPVQSHALSPHSQGTVVSSGPDDYHGPNPELLGRIYEIAESSDTRRRQVRDQPLYLDPDVSVQGSLLWPRASPPRCIPKVQYFRKQVVDAKALNYVENLDHNLLCPICYCPFESPRRLPCEHYFCKACLVQSFEVQEEGSRSCPACRTKVNRTDVAKAPKIVSRILDDLKVKCPRSSDGCGVEMPRSTAQDHLDRYCAFAEVRCPVTSCKLPVVRKDAKVGRCLHQVIFCKNCNMSLMEMDAEAHNQNYCSNRMTSCPNCKQEIRCLDLEAHTIACPDSLWPCPAFVYGCEYMGERNQVDQHKSTCALAKLAPFLKRQAETLETHEAALKHLRDKNSILEDSFQAIQETLTSETNLVESNTPNQPTAAGGPFDSTTHHLLSLYESLREEVSRVPAMVSELDAKSSMMLVNENLRLREDLSHTNSAINGMRLQLQWLVSARLQNQQRMAMGRTLGAPNDRNSPDRSVGLVQPMRRVSDFTRQETKL